VPTAETGGIEYRLRRLLADRLVLAVKLLLAGVVVERRGRLIGMLMSFNQGMELWEETKLSEPTSKDKPFVILGLWVWEAYRRVAANKG
jgi:hypothetical protein